MKRTVLLLSALTLLLLAAAVAPLFRDDPGLVQIHFLCRLFCHPLVP